MNKSKSKKCEAAAGMKVHDDGSYQLRDRHGNLGGIHVPSKPMPYRVSYSTEKRGK